MKGVGSLYLGGPPLVKVTCFPFTSPPSPPPSPPPSLSCFLSPPSLHPPSSSHSLSLPSFLPPTLSPPSLLPSFPSTIPPFLLPQAATGAIISSEELGGADVHCGISGCTDHYATTEEEALTITRLVIACLNLPPRPPSNRTTPGASGTVLGALCFWLTYCLGVVTYQKVELQAKQTSILHCYPNFASRAATLFCQ